MKKKPASLRRSMFMRLGFNFYDVAVTIFCVAFGLLCFYPLWYCLVASVMPYEEYVKGGLMLWFKGIDLQYYIQIFRNVCKYLEPKIISTYGQLKYNNNDGCCNGNLSDHCGNRT